MGRSILVAILATGAGLLAGRDGALAQQAPQQNVPALVGVEPTPEAASPGGAVYIPGVGFRYIAPGGPRVYGYQAYAARVYGYRSRTGRRACRERDWWGLDRCGRGWGW
jgi:hypothetical protein